MAGDDIKTVDDLKKPDEGDPSKAKPASKAPEEDITKADQSKMTEEQKNDYIDKLKYENAKRRIDNKKLKESMEKVSSELQTHQEKVSEMEEKIKEFEEAKKAAEMAEASELEKANAKLADAEKELKDAKKEVDKTNKALKESEHKRIIKEREVQIDRLVSTLDYQFSSTYERDGMMAELTETKEDGSFKLDIEEITLRLKEFFKDKEKPPETPGSGPHNKTMSQDMETEMKSLLSKKSLNADERKRLKEITDEIGKTQT